MPAWAQTVYEPFSSCALIDTYRSLGEKLSSANDAVSILMPMTVNSGRFCNLSAYTAEINASPTDQPTAHARPWIAEHSMGFRLTLPPFCLSAFPVSFFILYSISFPFPCRYFVAVVVAIVELV